MNKALKDKWFGETIEERLLKIPNELEIDAVGLWQIISFGREGFGLTGAELVEYARLNILALLNRGAKPVIADFAGENDWKIKEGYGQTREEIAQAIISEWLISGKDPDVGGLWFALPEMF